jgi:FixJ family two-component response regulator
MTTRLSGKLSNVCSNRLESQPRLSVAEKRFLPMPHQTVYRFAVLDIHMPEMTGLEVRSHLHKRWPQSRVILMTGREDLSGQVSEIRTSIEGFFTKPFDNTELLAVIHRVLAACS